MKLDFRLALCAGVVALITCVGFPAASGILQKLLGTQPSMEDLKRITGEQVGASESQVVVSNLKLHVNSWTWDAETPRGAVTCSMGDTDHENQRCSGRPAVNEVDQKTLVTDKRTEQAIALAVDHMALNRSQVRLASPPEYGGYEAPVTLRLWVEGKGQVVCKVWLGTPTSLGTHADPVCKKPGTLD
jgi:hypothetical protein